MISFLGHFHPLFVHLPIGMLVLGIIFKLISLKSDNIIYTALQPVIVLLSFTGAVFSGATGYLLSLSGGYENELLSNHQWSGISLIMLTGLLCLLLRFDKLETLQNLCWFLSAVLLGITGHLGGSLTHGEGFLSLSGNNYQKPVITDVQQAEIYTQIVEPIFAEKCWSCHSAKKQKGGLRMDKPEFISKGGDDGKVFLAHQAQKSNIVIRALLDKDDEDHMPPSGKPQLTGDEIKLISWWISEGADFDQKVSGTSPNVEITAILNKLSGPELIASRPDIPEKEIGSADAKAVEAIREGGVSIVRVAENSNYLLVNFNGRPANAKVWENLAKITENIVWLKAKDLQLDAAKIKVIGEMNNLFQLDLSGTNIEDASLKEVSKLTQLRTLNLNNTNLTMEGLTYLKPLKSLRSLYLFNTKITAKDWLSLKGLFPKTQLDSGNYKVPALKTDTVKLTADMVI